MLPELKKTRNSNYCTTFHYYSIVQFLKDMNGTWFEHYSSFDKLTGKIRKPTTYYNSEYNKKTT